MYKSDLDSVPMLFSGADANMTSFWTSFIDYNDLFKTELPNYSGNFSEILEVILHCLFLDLDC